MESTLISLLFYTSLLGLVMGYVVNKTNFCTMGAVSDLVNIGDSSRLKSWMLAAIVAVIGVNLSQMFGLFDVTESRIPYTNSLFFWPRYVLGGLLFGIGMTYASGCGNKVLIRLGGGNLKSLFVLIFVSSIASKNAGHPEPESYFVSELKSSLSQPAQVYVPSSL